MPAPEKQYKVAVVSDDFNTETSIRNALRLDVPVHATMIVTNDEHFAPVEGFIRANQRALRIFEPGVHISLTGKFTDNPDRIFGEDGKLLCSLYQIESAYRRSPAVGKVIRRHLTHRFASYNSVIRDEFHRQVDYAAKFLEADVPYLTYHFGMHYWKVLYDAYEKVAQERGIPYRRAVQYTSEKRDPRFLEFYDKLNHPFVRPRHMLVAFAEIEESKRPTEMCLHLSNHDYAEEQVRAFMDPGVRRVRDKFRFDMPHKLVHGFGKN
jgi:predicted glycoside hydrolase/deacetylase ChbG (UPF0249 family)